MKKKQYLWSINKGDLLEITQVGNSQKLCIHMDFICDSMFTLFDEGLDPFIELLEKQNLLNEK